MKHFIAMVRAVLLRGAALPQVGMELAALAAFAALILPPSVRLHSKRAA